MTVLDRLVLPADVLIVPVAELPAELRAQIDHVEGDCSITRPRSRTASSVIDAMTAALLARFRSPSTIVDAVIAHSAAVGVDPRATLEEAVAVLGGFVNDGLLVPPDSELALPIESAVIPGETLGGFEVVAGVRVMLDTAVHLARSASGEPVALKVARDAAAQSVRTELAHEARLLASLDGRVTPRLLAEGEAGGRPFLAMSWCAGGDAYEAAEEARRLGGPEGRRAVLGLAEGVVAAYAHLHAQGVLHGDVHPRNVLVGGDGAVWIIDFGLGGRPLPPGTPVSGGRGGVDLFLEPELAEARLAGRRSPAVSAAGEQYSIAALLYVMLVGAHTHTFALDQSVMLGQLVEDEPLAFARHGVEDLGAVEGVLRRALAKAPGDRYPSVAVLLAELREAATSDLRTAARSRASRHDLRASRHAPRASRRAPRASRRAPRASRVLLDEVLARLAIPDGGTGSAGVVAPTASVQNGAAGFAYALLRIAAVRGDERLLGQADVWCQRALRASLTPEGFRNDAAGIVPEKVGERSLYHAVPGVHAVAALVAAGRCDRRSGQDALDAFVGAAGEGCDELDVGFGRAGLLLGCALLLEASPPELAVEPLRRLGARLTESLAAEVADQPELALCTGLRSLGAAHGWAGVLFALLRWAGATGSGPPSVVAERLEELGALGQPVGRGTRWPQRVGESPLENPLAAGWCNGAAGYVALWTLAHQMTGDATFARLAQTAAWAAYEDPDEIGSLCCGLGGRAYALLNVYRHGGGDAWLARARVLADRAALGIRRDDYRPDSLYNGRVGVALLAADLEDPLHACMPLYESEGWQRHNP